MAKFSGDEQKTTEAKENEQAMQNMSLSIRLVDKTTGKDYTLENEKVVAVRFKERKGQLFLRLKGENGHVLSIPKQKIPDFIKIEEEKRALW
jgi:hypothetical protein